MWPDDKLVAGFSGKVLQVANHRMPRYWRRRQDPKDKHTNTLFYEDLVAAGVAAMWGVALKFDLASGYRFWTAARLPVLGAISDEARLWRRGGSGESRLDRWLYTHRDASPEQIFQAQQRLVKRPVFHSLQEAAEGIKAFWAWASNSEFDFDDEIVVAGNPSLAMYGFFDPYQLSPHRRIHERFSLLIDQLTGGLDTGADVGEVSRPKEPRDLRDHTETAIVRFKNGKRQVTRQKKASSGRLIPVTPELQAQAQQDFVFAKQRWQRRTRRGPMPAQQYPRWSTKFGAGRADHENKQIIPAYVPITRFRWKVEYRGAEGDVLSVLESPSRHCLKTKPCEFCEASRSHNVALPSLPPRRAMGRGSAAVDVRSANPRTKPRKAETREEKCQTQFAQQIATSRQGKHSSASGQQLPKRPTRTSRTG
jgi:hypothetical protein